MPRARLMIVGLAVLLGAAVSARQDATSRQTFVAGIDLVQVDVSVLDKNRRPVRGLQASDFTLLVDGKPQTVAAFAAVELPPAKRESNSAWTRDVASDVARNDLAEAGRLVVILMDRSIPFGLPGQSARGIAKAAIEQLVPGDLAAVVYTGSGAPQDFTSDRARLLSAIGENPAAGLSRDVSERWSVQKDRLEAEIWSEQDALRNIPKLLPAENTGECYCGVCVLDAITTIADAVRNTQGRQKSLLFIGADIVTDTQDPRCEAAVTDARAAMFKSLDLANLTVHAFDANGLETYVGAASSPQLDAVAPINSRPGSIGGPTPTMAAAKSQQLLTRQGHLGVLPQRTGGRIVLNNNNPEARVPDVFRESEFYYLLGFEPGMADGREHTINVQVNRRDVQVRARRAYIPSPVPAAGSPSADPTFAAIASVIPQRRGITLTVNPLVVASPGSHDPVVMLSLHAQHEASQGASLASREPVDIATTVFTLDGRPAGTFSQSVTVTAPEAGTPLAYDVLQRLPAKPGRYELRIAVNDAARDQSGSVYAFVDIPAFGKTAFAWSDIGLSAETARPATGDTVEDVVPRPPIARRDFDRQEHVTAFISGYHVSGDLPSPIEVVSRIVDDENHRKFEQKASLSAADFGASHAASYMLDLPLATLEPGAYLLSMETRAGKAKTTRYVRFSVR